MFQLNVFIMKIITAMIGLEPDYKVMQYAAGWYDKNVLSAEEMARVDALLEQHSNFQQAGETPEEMETESTTQEKM